MNALKTILLADDDPDDRLLFKEALAEVDRECQLMLAYDGKQAFASLVTAAKLPHLVILDLNMPVMSGIECLKLIRADRKFDALPVVMMSTSALEDFVSEAYAAGANLYIAKPQRYEQLLEIIRTLCSFDFTKRVERNAFLNLYTS